MELVNTIITEYLPIEFDLNNVSFISITTSNPVYLIFINERTPRFVIHELKGDEYLDILDIRSELYSVLAESVAKPYGIKKIDSVYYFIESGLNGKPWFQLVSTLKNEADWLDIKRKAKESLNYFKDAISNENKWCKAINLASELKAQFLETQKFNRRLIPEVESLVNKLSDILIDVDELAGTFQHCDYCINNLLFDHDRACIIDLEEFGQTSVPLQDELSLALSFYLIKPDDDTSTLKSIIFDCISDCGYSNDELKEILPSLYLYHLLFRLGNWGNNARREKVCQWIKELLHEFVVNPEYLFDS
jgi:hypothetical protein